MRWCVWILLGATSSVAGQRVRNVLYVEPPFFGYQPQPPPAHHGHGYGHHPSPPAHHPPAPSPPPLFPAPATPTTPFRSPQKSSRKLTLVPQSGPLPDPTTIFNKFGAPPPEKGAEAPGGYGGGSAPSASPLPDPITVEKYGLRAALKVSLSQCSAGDCWNVAEDQTLVRTVMFQRVSNITCAECLRLCKGTWVESTASTQRFCHSAVYDFNAGFCDHFDVTDASDLAQTQGYPGRVIFTPNPERNCEAPPCPEGEIMRLGACRPNTFEPRSEKVRQTGLLTGVKPAPNYNSQGFGSSEARVELDEECWEVIPNSAAVNSVMFSRTTDIPFDECAFKCQANLLEDIRQRVPVPAQDGEASEYACKSFVYDHRWAICDLYAVDSTKDNAGNCFVAPYRGRDYVRPIKDCEGGPLPTTPEPVDTTTETTTRKTTTTTTTTPRPTTRRTTPAPPSCDIEEFVAEEGVDPASTTSESCPAAFGVAVGEFCVHTDEELRDACDADRYCADNAAFLPTELTQDQLDFVFPEMLEFIGPESPTFFYTDGFNDQLITAWKSTLFPSPLSQSITGEGDCVALDIVAQGIVRVPCDTQLPTVCLRRIEQPATIPPAEPACPKLLLADGTEELQVPRYGRLVGRRKANPQEFLIETLVDSSEFECIQRCNDLGSNCAGFVLQEDGACLLYSTGIEFDRGLEDFVASDYYQRICFPALTVEGTGLVYDVWPQKVLIGFAVKEVAARSLKECMLHCLDNQANVGFVCNSAMYYPTEILNDDGASCILNEETRESQPDLFIEETLTSPMYYFDVGRGPGVELVPVLKASDPGARVEGTKGRRPPGLSILDYVKQRRARPPPVQEVVRTSEWSEWSSCETSTTGLRFRYRPCGRKLLYKCPRQFAICKDKLAEIMGFESESLSLF